MTELQYLVSTYCADEHARKRAEMHLQHLAPSNNEGVLIDSSISRLDNPWMGRFLLFQSLDNEVARLAYTFLSCDPDLTVLPMRKLSYIDGVLQEK